MSVLPPAGEAKGLALLATHCSNSEPKAPSARERLETLLGSELAQKLVTALSRGAPDRERFAA